MEIKRPTTIEEQIKILGGRKLVIEDVVSPEDYGFPKDWKKTLTL